MSTGLPDTNPTQPPGEAAEQDTLLVVAPLRLNSELLAVALASHLSGWNVVATHEPKKAIDVCGQYVPRVVILDASSDHQFLQWGTTFTAQWPHLAVLALDNTSNDALVRLTLSLGFSGYVTKEQSIHAVIAAIREVRSGRRVFPPDVTSRMRLTAGGLRLVEDQRKPWSRLTSRELDVLTLIAQGHSVANAAKLLGISPATVDNHKTRLMQKLRIHKATQLAAWAVGVGLITTAAQSSQQMMPRPQLTDPEGERSSPN